MPSEAGLLEGVEDVVRVLAGLVELLGARRDNVAGDAARRVLDQPVLFAEFEVHGRAPKGEVGTVYERPGFRAEWTKCLVHV